MLSVEFLKNRILEGGEITFEEGVRLINEPDADLLYEAAHEILLRFKDLHFGTCSIVNARSGRCSEDCKWCAQSCHYNTKVKISGVISERECLSVALDNYSNGVERFSLVTSGKSVSGYNLEKICSIVKAIERETDGGLKLCASLGLLDEDDLMRLYDSGVSRYHCNLETAPSLFPKLCTTHTLEQKSRTIELARKVGLEICSGGIIGMGENRRQRVEFGCKLKAIAPESIPINILIPILGTPLENMETISEEEILRCIAVFRFINPRCDLRFAGGRSRLSREAQLKCIYCGINSGIVGDLLTTLGSKIEEDRMLVRDAGFNF